MKMSAIPGVLAAIYLSAGAATCFSQSVATLEFSPNPVTGGQTATGTVTLTEPAREPGDIRLSSSDANASLPSSVIVPAGGISATFAVRTTDPCNRVIATITATYNATSRMERLAINPSSDVASLTIVPAMVVGGADPPANGTVTLNQPAACSGLIISLSSSDTRVRVPPSISFAAGESRAGFLISHTATAVAFSATITATLVSSVIEALQVFPAPSISALSFSPNPATGGETTTGTVRLTAAAPTAGAVVTLSTDDPHAAVPANVTVPAGQSSATFTAPTRDPCNPVKPTITATYNGTVQAELIINPSRGLTNVAALSIVPNRVMGGQSAIGTVRLNQSAACTLTIALRTSDGRVEAPPTVSVSSGASSADFTITTTTTLVEFTATITASLASAVTATLTVGPRTPSISVSELRFDPNPVVGGQRATGKVVLTGAAPSGDAVVTLSSGDSQVRVPATVTISAGSDSATFTVVTADSCNQVQATITATYNGTVSAQLTVNPSGGTDVASLAIVPNRVTGGRSVAGTVRLNQAALCAATITLLTSDSRVRVPPTVSVAVGASGVDFTIATSTTPLPFTATITARLSSSVTATLNVDPETTIPVSVAELGFTPNPVAGGQSVTAKLTLTGAAPSGGAVIALSSNDSHVRVPLSVTVPAGSDSATFTVATADPCDTVRATITATHNGTISAQLIINPSRGAADVAALSIVPNRVTGGQSAVGTVRLNQTVLCAVAVTLRASDSRVLAPSSVSVPAGASSAEFPITTSATRLQFTATVTAGLGSSVAATLVVEAAGPSLTVTISELSLGPNPVTGGQSAIGKLALSGAAPEGGAVVALSSDDSHVRIPDSVTIPAGSDSAAFTIATADPCNRIVATITATFNGAVQARLTINASRGNTYVTDLNVSPTTVTGGQTATGAATLNQPAPCTGIDVALISSDRRVQAPAVLTVRGGALSATFAITTSSATADFTATLTGALITTVTSTLAVRVQAAPPGIRSLALSPNPVTGGQTVTATITLSGPAPAGGSVVALASSEFYAQVPPSVTVPSGSDTATFSIRTTDPCNRVVANITATSNGTVQEALFINSARGNIDVAALTFAPNPVRGGQPFVGTVALTGAVPCSGIAVSLRTGDSRIQAPSTVTVAGGQTSGAFSSIAPVTPFRFSATVSAALSTEIRGSIDVEPPENATPALALSPRRLTFDVLQGSGNPPAQSVTIDNSGLGELTWSATAEITGTERWLRLAPGNGAAPSTLTVSVDAAGLTPGVHQGNITVRSIPTGESQNILVVFTVVQPQPILTATQRTLVFFGAEGEAAIPPQTFEVQNAGTGRMNWQITVPAGITWLRVSPLQGLAEGGRAGSPVRVEVDPSSLREGLHSALLTLRAEGARESPKEIVVQLNLRARGSQSPPSVTPVGLMFTSAGTLTREVSIHSSGAERLQFSARAQVSEGSHWLSVSPAQGEVVSAFEPARVQVRVQPAGLRPGIYSGSVVLSFSTGLSQEVAVVLIVRPAAIAASSVGQAAACVRTRLALVETYVSSGSLRSLGHPVPLLAEVRDDCEEVAGDATVSARLQTGDFIQYRHLGNGLYNGTWLPPASLSARTSVQMTLRAEAAGVLPAQASIPVTLSAEARIPPSIAAVVEGATFQATPLAPGGIFTLFGGGFAQEPNVATQLPLPRNLGEVRVIMAGADLPLYYAGPGGGAGQINAQVPFDGPPGPSSLLVVSRGVLAAPQEVIIGSVQPRIFVIDPRTNRGAILNANFQIVDSSNPVAAGDVLQIFCTGLGATTPSVATGNPAPAVPPLAEVNIRPTATIGGVNAEVVFAGLAPGFVGLYQVNVRILSGTAAGDAVPLVLRQGGISSNTVALPIR